MSLCLRAHDLGNESWQSELIYRKWYQYSQIGFSLATPITQTSLVYIVHIKILDDHKGNSCSESGLSIGT